jgi:UDP:flavonoid glycosyltransferase YjiC (YdhE family)
MPLLPVLDALARAGHERLVVAPPGLAGLPAGHPTWTGAAPPEREVRAILDVLPTASRQEGAVLGNRELFGRLWTAAMLPAVERASRTWRPDLVLREPCEYASAIVAEREGIPHAQVAISLAQVEDRSLSLAAPALDQHAPGIAERLRAAPYLTRFPASLDPSPFADTRRYREERAAPAPLPDWWGGCDAPLVYVTFGSMLGELPAAAATYRAAVDAIAPLSIRVLLTVGRAFDPAAVGEVPANVHVERWVPQADILAVAAAVVAHGGSGTTLGALAAGLPLVLLPQFADQHVNAERVAAAGAGTIAEPDSLRGAVEAVLADPSFARAARRLAGELHAAPPVGTLLRAFQP